MANTNEEILIKLKALDELSPVMLKALQSMEATTAKMSAALDEVGAASKKTADATEGLHGKTVTMSAGFLAVKGAAELAYKAFEKMSEFLGHAIDEATEAEKASNRLKGALISTGQYATESAKALDEYAESIQKTTGASAESIKNIMAQGIQMGLSTEKAKKLEEATRELAAATGESLESAFSTMQASLAGQSRALGKVLPEVKELTTAQLKNGDAIAIVTRSLKAQYDLYQGSYTASLDRAKSSIGDVYKEIGKMITQSPIAVAAINGFSSVLNDVVQYLEHANEWLKENQATVKQFMTALGQATIVVAAAGVAMGISAIAAGALAGAIAIITSPVTLVVAAVALLTAAFYKWPGLFDVITGAIKGLIGLAITPLSLAFGAMTTGIGTVVGLFDKDLGNAIKSAGDKLSGFRDNLIITGFEQAKMGVESIAAGKQVEASMEGAGKAMKDTAKEASDLALAHQRLHASYGGIDIGTEKQRQNLELQVSQRDDDLKKFTTYLEEKKRLAVTAETEQQNEMNKVRANALQGAGSSGKAANSQVEVDAEKSKQAQLVVERNMGILNMEQYNNALIESSMRQQTAELEMAQAHSMALADALGTSEAGFQLKLANSEAQWQLEQQNNLMRAQMEGATQEQIQAARESSISANLARQSEMKQKYIEDDIKKNQQLGNDWEVTLGKMRLAQEKDGKILGTIRGVQQTQEYKGTMGALGDLASLRSSKNKEAFEVGKKAAIAQATVQTFLAATEAFASLASIPIVGPVLGAAAAAAAVAAGFVQIQNISSQQFSQAHGGIDEVPGNLDNSTFLLKGGERVVQPEANRDLTNFLATMSADKAAEGKNPDRAASGSGGTSYNITLNYQGEGTQQDANKMTDMVIEAIRQKSERGQPIISSKGVVQE